MKLLQLLEENKNKDMFICREEFESYSFFVPKKDKGFIYLVDKYGKYLMTDSGCRVMWNPAKKDLLADNWIVYKYGRPEGEADYATSEGYVVTTEQYSLIQTQKAINDTLNKLLDRMSEGTVHTNQGEWHTARTVNHSVADMPSNVSTAQACKAMKMLKDTLSKTKDEHKEDRRYSLAEAYSILKDKDNHYTKMIDVWDLTEWELTTDGETLISQNNEGVTAWLPSRDDLLKSTKYRIE